MNVNYTKEKQTSISPKSPEVRIPTAESKFIILEKLWGFWNNNLIIRKNVSENRNTIYKKYVYKGLQRIQVNSDECEHPCLHIIQKKVQNKNRAQQINLN